MNFLSSAQDCLLVVITIHLGYFFHVVLCFKMHHFGLEMQSKKLSTRHVMLNPIGPNIPLQTRMPTSPNPFLEPNQFEKELLEENGLLENLLEDKTKTEVLLDGGGGSTQMSIVDCLLFQKLKNCSSQEKTLERLSKSLHLANSKKQGDSKMCRLELMSRYSVFPFSI